MSSRAVALAIAFTMLVPIALPLVPTAAAAASPAPASFSFINYPAPSPFGRGSNEPTIGVNWETGKVFTIAGSDIYRVTFNDLVSPATALWEDAAAGELHSQINVDPVLFTDAEDGRTYAGGLDGACSILAYTDDDGANWVPMTNSCAPPGWDHQTVFAGAWHEGELKDTALYPRAVYYCAQPGLTQGPAFCGVSQDGGLTFRDSVPMYTLGECHGLHGKGKVAPDGTVGVPNKGCLTNAGAALSEDNGLTWDIIQLPTTVKGRFDPALAWTTDNWLYLGATGGNGRAVIGMSKDKGQSWETIRDVTPPGVAVTEFAQVIAGDNERAAFAFLGSEKGPNSGTCNNAGQQIWHMYVSMTYNGGATWETSRISTDPVQRGPIGDFDNPACRNMLDFNDVTIDAEGRVLVSYTDGCTGACAGPTGTVASSNGGVLTIARQATGRGLFAEHDDATVDIVAPLVGAAGDVLTLSANVGATAPYTATVTWGDGSSAEVFTAQTTAVFTATHVYGAQGEYDITLSVVGADGVSASDSTTATISGGGGSGSVRIDDPVEGATVGDLVTVTGIATLGENLAPTAAFTFAVTGNDVSFDASGSSDPEGGALAFAWAFGDGANGAGVAPSHTYASPGTYNVCVTASDGILSDEACLDVTIGSTSTRTTLAEDPQGDAKNPLLANAGGGTNVPSLDIRKLEAEINPNGEPVFHLTIDSITTPTAPTGEGADGAVWRVEWTNPSGKTDFVQVSVTALGTVQGGYGDTDTNGIYAQRGAAVYTFVPGTPGTFTITYPTAALAARGYSSGATLASLVGSTLVYRGTPQDVPVSAGGTTQYDATTASAFVLSSFNAGVAAIGHVNTQAAKPAPSAPPASPQIVDVVSDPVGDNVPTLNIQSGWFDSDAENLYVGAKIADIPADQNSTAFLYYSINFKPSWTPADPTWNGAVPPANTFTGLRVTALYSPVARDGTTPQTPTSTQFELQALSTVTQQSRFGRVANLTGSVSPTSDIIWWVVPRAVLQNPVSGDFLTATSGASAPAVGGTVTFGTAFGDATGTGTDYLFPFEEITPPTVTLAATPSTGVAPLSVSFAAAATGTIASWSLNFGDGETASGTGAVPATFSHVYDGSGTFVARLTAVSTNGASGTGEATVVVGSTPPPAPVEVLLTVDGLEPVSATCSDDCATWSADLDLSTLPDGDVTIVATLRNGGTPLATDTVGVTLARVPAIVITAPGDGADVASGEITITGKIASASNRPPSASLAADRTEGVAPLTVTFTLDGMDDDGVASWRFQSDDGVVVDGTTLPAQHVETYDAPGTYRPSLRVVDTRGASDTFATTIVVTATNTPPGVPSDPTPADGATGVAVPAALGWTATDADGNTLTYDVYLGATNPPPLVATGQTASYLAGGLEGETTYFWSVVAKDASSSTAGAVWSFTTAAAALTQAQRPQTVVALIDTGMNPYHQEFRRPALVDNPSTYISGLPASQLVEVDLCFYDPATKTVAQSRCPASADAAAGNDAAKWAPFDVSPAGARAAGAGEIAWFPGTNVMLVSFGHVGDQNYPGMDGARGAGDEHGTWTTSNVGGLTTGTCPECIVVLIEGDTVAAIEDAYWWASNQPWIDVISSSVSIGLIGVGANPADFFDATSAATKNAVANGKLVFESSGNGIANAGVAPTSTYLGANANPWTIAVGCSAEHTGQQCFYSDYPNPITASGIDRIGASVDTYIGTAGVGGTSFSAPSSAGVAARTIYALRSAMNDVAEGPSGAQKTLVRVGPGASAPSAGPLANGALTRLEVEEAIFKTARRALTPQVPWYIFPVEMVDTPANFVKAGYGQVYRGDWGVNGPGAEATWSSAGDATNVLLGAKTMPNRWFEEQWWETIVEPTQEAIFAAELPDTDTDAFPGNDAFDPSGLDGYAGASTLDEVPRVVSASAAVPNGAVPTPSQNRLYFHHNVLTATTYEKYLNSVANPAQGIAACNEINANPACPDRSGIGATGIAPAGNSATYRVSYPSLGAPVLLDTTKDVVIHVSASGFIQPPTPLTLRATLMSAGAVVGTGASGLPAIAPPFDGVYEIRFKPTASVLTDAVEVTLAWDGPAYSFHVNSQGESWIDLPILAALPPVDFEPVTYYVDNFAGWTSNGGTVALTRDATKLAGDANKNTFFAFPQATGVVVNLVGEDALVDGEALLGTTGTASLYLCTNQVDAGAAVYTAKLALSVDGVPIGGGSITKQMVGSNTGRTVPVSIPLTLNPHLIKQGVPISGAFVLSGPGGAFTQNMGVCGGGADKPWKLTLAIGELDTTPTVSLGDVADTLRGVQTISGTASFPAVPSVGEVTWYAQDMDTWDTQHDAFRLETGAPGIGSGGPIFEPSPDGWVLTFTSARDAREDAPAIAANGVGTASFWVTGVPAATDVTVDFTVLLQNGASQRVLGSGSLTKHVLPPLGTVALLWDEQFIVGFTPQVTDPQPGEKVVMIVKVRNVGPATTTHVSCLCGGPDMPVYVTLPTDLTATAASPVVDVTLGEIAAIAPVVDGAWSVDVDTRTIANGDYTLTATPRALYGGVSRTGLADTEAVSVSNVGLNTPPTASIGVAPASGIAPLSVTATIGGSDAQTGSDLLAWSIDWGDGSAASTGTGVPATATHVYATGSHLATLTITDAGGMIATATSAVSAFDPPPVEKVVVILDGGAPVDATDLTGDGSFRDWSATFSLPNAGTHSVTARHMRGDEIVSEASIGFNTIGNVVDVEIHSPGSGTTVGSNAAIVGSSTYNGTVTSVEASTDGFATAILADTTDGFRTWSIGVGSLGLPEDVATAVAVRATTPEDAAFDSIVLTLDAAPNPTIEIVTSLPVATGETVQFQAGGTPAQSGAAIVAWAWDLGDGTTSTEQHPSHAYADDGTYTVSLAATDANGATGSTQASVLVLNRLPSVSLATSPTDPTTTDTVTLSASASDVDGIVVSVTTFAYAGSTRESGILASGDATLNLQFPDDGRYLLVARAVDNDGGAGETESLLTVHNRRPVALLTAAPLLVGEGQTVSFDASASSDPDGSIVEYRFDLGDGTPTIVQPQATLTHAYAASGIYPATVTVVDDDESSITSEAVLVNVNARPTLDPVGNKQVGEGETLTFALSATDPEGDTLTYSVNATPAGASLDPTSGVFTWTPTFSQDGSYFLRFTAHDGLSGHSRDAIISVGNVPLPPTLEPIGPKAGVENSLLAFDLVATDPDTPMLTFSATGLPAGATLTWQGQFRWTPSFEQSGPHTVTFSVTDGTFVVSEVVVITIANVDRPVTLDAVATGSVKQLATLIIPLAATDLDGDLITFAVAGPPGVGVQDLGNGDARLVWTPTLAQLGAYEVTVFALAGDAVASRTTTLTALFTADVTVADASGRALKAAPGQVVAVPARITNTGPQADSFRISAANSAGWTLLDLPADPIPLASGESTIVTLSVVADGAKPISFTTISATSIGDGLLTKSARIRVDIPVVVNVTIDNVSIEGTHVSDRASGKVKVTHLDGTPAVGALVTAIQTPTGAPFAVSTTQNGVTNEEGIFTFDFTRATGGLLPGKHDLLITAKKNGGFDTLVKGAYHIGG